MAVNMKALLNTGWVSHGEVRDFMTQTGEILSAEVSGYAGAAMAV